MKVQVGIKKKASKNSTNQAPTFDKTADKSGESRKLAALLTEFQEFKRVTTAERDALVSEHNALAKEVCDLRDQIEEASLVGTIPNDSNSKENESGSQKTDMMAEIKNQVEATAQQAHATAQHALVAVADNFDENGYMKCCLGA